MILDFEPLSHNPNFNVEWISDQQYPSLKIFQEYLGSKTPDADVAKLMHITKKRNIYSTYLCSMLKKYAPLVQNRELYIIKDQNVLSLQFVDFLPIDKLFVFECFSLRFDQTPSKITHLIINRCEQNDLKGFEKMQQIQELSLRSNKITEKCLSQEVMSSFTKLTNLDLGLNELNNIDNIIYATSLTELDISHNYVENIDQIKQLANLVKLDASSISSVQNFGNLQLTYLNLSNNQLYSIIFLENLTNLVDLNISFNKITKIDYLKLLNKLDCLYLDGNAIYDFKPLFDLQNSKLEWFGQQNLQYLDDMIKNESNDLQKLQKQNQVKYNINMQKILQNYVQNKEKSLDINDSKILQDLTNINILKLDVLSVSRCPHAQRGWTYRRLILLQIFYYYSHKQTTLLNNSADYLWLFAKSIFYQKTSIWGSNTIYQSLLGKTQLNQCKQAVDQQI
ncbi:Conserved_hypothetical protein [Hexamita inflata]|uniref:Uncharacterized protein n=1 Tax=Hexamita inflata TaxID=28002 RepID=A0AA86QK08_9EUKA|nr:Conserved hypothetical protein [Hexamita inflata]